MLRTCLALALTGFLGSLGLAIPAPETPCPRRTLPLIVEDSQGVPIEGLGQSDFEARAHSGPATILSLVPDDRPHRIVLFLDASGSMESRWKAVTTLGDDLVETPLPNTQIALVIFGKQIYEHIDFPGGRAAIAYRLRQIRSGGPGPVLVPHGKTALFDSMLEALHLLNNPSSADSFYLVTDGGDNTSKARFNDVVQAFTSSSVRVFSSFVVDLHAGRTPEQLPGIEEINDLAHKTGGEMIVPFGRDPEKIAAEVHNFYQKMVRSYRVEIELSGSSDKQRLWELKASPGSKDRLKNARLVYPQELPACRP